MVDLSQVEIDKDNTVDLKEYDHLLDRIYFAEKYMKSYLKEGLRKFQKEIINVEDKQVVLRIGRRAGKTVILSVKSVYEAISNEDYRIVIITPGKNHYELIYDTIMNKLILPSPELKACVTRSIKTPGKIWFSSGSTISFFTAGTKSGSGAVGVRGQGAELVIIDEADYLSAVDMETILALRIEHPDITFWASSTPTGKRGFFYQWCTDKSRGWREFHYTAPQANPNWNAEIEEFTKREYPGEAYKREILAEFGTEDAGVFNKELIDYACSRGDGFYCYQPFHNPFYGYAQGPNWHVGPRAIGVDWDKYGAPTNMVVVEMMEDGVLHVINRTQVPQSEFTLTNAVNILIKLNEIWKPNWIYIDRGFGEMQAEILKLYGKSHKETMLDKIVKPISFSSKIAITDPSDGTVEHKDIKPFMINMLQRTIEDKKLVLNSRDDVMKMQLINYAVERYGANGRPIYTNKDDHCVDALALANFAIVQNYDDIFKVDVLSLLKRKPILLNNMVKHVNSKYLSVKDFAMDKVNPAYQGDDRWSLRRGTGGASSLMVCRRINSLKSFSRKMW